MPDPLGIVLLLLLGAGGKQARKRDPLGLDLDTPRPDLEREHLRRLASRSARELSTPPPVKLTDTTFPGDAWVIDSPPSEAAIARAKALLPVLWGQGEGTGVTEDIEGRPTGFLATAKGDGSQGVTIWRLKSGSVIRRVSEPESAPAPKPRKRAAKPVSKAKSKTREPEPVKVPPKPAAPVLVVEEPAPEPEKNLPVPTAEQDADESQYPFALRPDKPLLMQGSSGPAVEELQRLLGITGKLGFYGPMTVDRVKAYQKAKGLPVDGKTGEVTWGSLLA